MIKIFEQNKILSAFTTILIAIGIFIISQAHSNYQGTYPNTELLSVLYHFFAFFFFGLFLLITFTKNKNFEFLIPSIIVSIIYAILDELHQYFVPGRFSSFGDVITDTAGIVLASLMYYNYKKYLS